MGIEFKCGKKKAAGTSWESYGSPCKTAGPQLSACDRDLAYSHHGGDSQLPPWGRPARTPAPLGASSTSAPHSWHPRPVPGKGEPRVRPPSSLHPNTEILGGKHRSQASYRQQEQVTRLPTKLKQDAREKLISSVTKSGLSLLLTVTQYFGLLHVCHKCSLKLSTLMRNVKPGQKISCFTTQTLAEKKIIINRRIMKAW